MGEFAGRKEGWGRGGGPRERVEARRPTMEGYAWILWPIGQKLNTESVLQLITIGHRSELPADSISLNDMCPDWNAVGVSADDSVYIFPGKMILRIFRSNYDVKRLGVS
jgi:hypothetical protein